MGEVVEDVFFKFEHLRPWEQPLCGAPIRAVEARGKAMLIRSAAGVTIYSHNQLYGKWVTRRRASGPPTSSRDLRLSIVNQKSAAYLYSASDIFVMMDGEVEAFPPIAKLGPDLLSAQTDLAVVRARIDAPAFQRRGLAALYLDQGFLAGPGNYLRSEILFVAMLHPRRRPVDLSTAQRQRLAEATLAVTERAYRTGGITTEDALAARLKARGWSRRQHRHYVFGRAGGACHRCGSTIEKTNMTGRRVYICPGCQPLAG